MLTFSFPQLDRPLRAVFLGAHSDDIEIGCGATVLGLVNSKVPIEVLWVVFSGSGERRAEAQVSAAGFLAGVATPRISVERFRDGYFPMDPGIKDCFESLKSFGVPDVVFTHVRDDRHQDHRVVSDLTWNTFRESLILEYEIPKYDGDLGRPNVFVPLTEVLLDQKVRLLHDCFGSQRSKPWFSSETFRGLARLRGVEAAAPSGFAEAFVARKVGLGFG